ncbi:MAG: vitamin K epoxide reductase family protein [Bacteroidetes bacterium]|nr:vitamin K epoxide reductase family protein [Bacteroidota bacterium]
MHNNLFLVVSFLGLVGTTVCFLIIQHNAGVANVITNALWGTDENSGCGKIINSSAGRIIKHVHLADIAIFYFLTQLLLLLVSVFTKDEGNFSLLTILSIAAFLFTFYSLWYQWHIQTWCALCLMVTGIVWLQTLALTARANSFYFSTSSVLQLSFSILIAFSWFILKHYITTADDAVKKTVEALRWKRNPSVFVSLLKAQRRVSGVSSHCPSAGNSDAPVHITVVSNPYCKPCSRPCVIG